MIVFFIATLGLWVGSMGKYIKYLIYTPWEKNAKESNQFKKPEI